MIPELYKLSTSSSLESPEQRHAILADERAFADDSAGPGCSRARRKTLDRELRTLNVVEMVDLFLSNCFTLF